MNNDDGGSGLDDGERWGCDPGEETEESCVRMTEEMMMKMMRPQDVSISYHTSDIMFVS